MKNSKKIIAATLCTGIFMSGLFTTNVKAFDNLPVDFTNDTLDERFAGTFTTQLLSQGGQDESIMVFFGTILPASVGNYSFVASHFTNDMETVNVYIYERNQLIGVHENVRPGDEIRFRATADNIFETLRINMSTSSENTGTAFVRVEQLDNN